MSKNPDSAPKSTEECAKTPQISLIACISRDRGLGKNGELLWNIPEDMKFFRKTTTNHTVVMGRKTFASIGRPLPNRHNIIISHHKNLENTSGVTIFTLPELESYLAEAQGEVFIIGGATLYDIFLPKAQTLYLTEVDAEKPADTYFPDFDRADFSSETLQTGEYNDVKYNIIKYTRKEIK